MGTVSFLLPDPVPAEAARCLDEARLAVGYDQSPVPTQRKIENGRLELTKDASESGYLAMPWPVPGGGTPVCLSATLREQPEPYHLVLELARGKLNQVRNLTAEWVSIGMAVDAGDRVEMEEATRSFGRAVIDPASPDGAALAADVLGRSLRLGDRLARAFAEQLLQTRLAESGKLITGIGYRLVRVPSADEQARIAETGNAVRLVPDWRAIEPTEAGYNWTEFDALVDWATGAELQVSVGPLIDLDGAFPDWLAEWHGDLPSVAAFTCDFIETVVRRYQDRVSTWQVFAGFNHRDALGLGEDDRIRLAARLLEAARQADAEGEWVIGLAQPWGDYLASEDYTYSPLVFADTLMRAGFTPAALDLGLTLGAKGPAGHTRDPLEVYRILELFSVLGVPLEVTVRADGEPSSGEEAALALAVALPQVRSVLWTRSADSAGSIPPMPAALKDLRSRFIA
ncbi:MAG TPA: endo-1,4-beta-xylanase [Fimbriiglobus sp.]|nr:endo-1,4-beta-xylanase [Fimbriiglobus sp.]